MHETAEDIDRLQRLLDTSAAGAGSHLRSIFTPEHRVSARALADLLGGVRVLSLATVTARGEPRVGPVDGLFVRGRFYFGSSPDSVRFGHLARRPAVSAAYVEGEAVAVVVHGTAHRIDTAAPEQEVFRRTCLEVYGPEWEEWTDETAAYAVIEAWRLFTRITAEHPLVP